MSKKVLMTTIFVVAIGVALSLSQVQAAAGYRLRTSEGWTVGHAFVANDANNLTITFKMKYDLGFCITESQLHVADTWQQIPQENGSPAPYQFDYVGIHDCVDEVEYVVSLGGWQPGDTITIAAHAVIGNWMDKPYPGWEETGWAAGCESVRYSPEPDLDCEIYAPYSIKEYISVNPEHDALLALYDSTNGDDWWWKDNWLDESIHHCEWYGVDECDEELNVIELDLAPNNLVGSIPSELGNFPYLKRLYLNWNTLSGPIPPELGNLTNLEQLVLFENQLSGCIPAELSNLTNLTSLVLDEGSFSGWETQESLNWALGLDNYSGPENVCGSPPDTVRSALVAIYNSTNGDDWYNNTNWLDETIHHCDWYGVDCDGENEVSGLILTQNNLAGTIPQQELESLEWLEVIDFWDNQLNGYIPPEIGNMSRLEELVLGKNQLTGSIPPELGNLTSLMSLQLSQNELTGPIPPELGNLENLRGLYLSSNQLEGPIPSELGNLEFLNAVDLSDNQFTESIPPELGNQNLWSLNLSNNQLTGAIPPDLGNLYNLLELDLAYNQLSGCIPSELSSMVNLWDLWLSDNLLDGWETQAALDWALSLDNYQGPDFVAASCP